MKDIPRGWHSRGYLPHFDGGEICQFITLRLGDAVSQKTIRRWKLELENEKDEDTKLIIARKVERYIDRGYGKCWLNRPEVAEIVRNNLFRFDDVRYKLIAWVIMPNHTHYLIKPINKHSLSTIIKNHKSYTAHTANKILGRTGKFWYEDYFDRFIRDHEYYIKTVDYIENNPVKAGLCEDYRDWKFSSAYNGTRTDCS